MTTLPSLCTPTALTAVGTVLLGLNVPSRLPSTFNRATRYRVLLWTVVKSPPIKTRPSAWTSRQFTIPETPLPVAMKLASSEPLG